MSADITAIFNEALGIAGARDNITVPEENSREAEVCRLWYPTIRDSVQRAAPWPSNKAFARLAVAREREGDTWVTGDPEPGYRFAYRGPDNMLYPRYLSTFERFTLSVDDAGRQIINANTEEAILTYSLRNDRPTSWDVALRSAIVQGLAAAIISPLNGKLSLANQALSYANQKIMEAQQLIGNVGEGTYDIVPDWIAARGYSGGYQHTRFIFPFGPMLTMGMFGHAR